MKEKLFKDELINVIQSSNKENKAYPTLKK